ncbi:MAG: redox-sensing transcriptional repressor Rex [bacterium]
MKIPEKTIERLLHYYRYLHILSQQGTLFVSSKNFASLMTIKPDQVRKDLSYFGRLGKRGAGYDVLLLRNKIAEILGIAKESKVCIVGMGSLGSAMAAYKGFETLGFKIVAVFDNSEIKIGRKIRGYYCYDIKQLDEVIKRGKISIAMLTVPTEAAKETATNLAKAGIKGIMNFSPVKLTLTGKIKVRNIDMAQELKTLSFFIEK